MVGDNSSSENRHKRLRGVLDRTETNGLLDCLSAGVKTSTPNFAGLASSAISFDANVILRLPTHSAGADVIDYIDQCFNGPLILSFQAVQEFWNNTLPVIDTVGKKLKRRLDELKKEGGNLGSEFQAYSSRIEELVGDLESQFGYLFDEATTHKISGFLETLKRKAIISTVSRADFFQIAEMRKRTKTPPGFCDDGHGDFYVWLEILDGALGYLEGGNSFTQLILVTNDKKDDWVRDGVPHPVLAAEAQTLIEKPFQIWKLDDFVKAVKKELAGA